MPRARPVAGLPLDALLAHAPEVARRWAIAMLTARPLDRMGELPLEQLACDAPELCAQAIRALASDVELDRLTGAGAPGSREASAPARRLARIAGVHEVGAAVAAVEALRGVLSETILEELRSRRIGAADPLLERSPARDLLDVADRLACVCAGMVAVAAAAVSAEHDAAASGRDARAGDPIVAQGRGARERDPAPSAGGGPVIVDERPASPGVSGLSASERAPSASERVMTVPEGGPDDERPLSWDESPPVPPRARAGEIEIRDERREQGAVAWIRSIGRQLERFERDGLPFAALLVELGGVERLPRLESATLSLAGAVEQAFAAELRASPSTVAAASSGAVTQERPGKYWVLAPETDRAGAERLAERLARAAQASMGWRSSSLEVAIGTAVCPDDGREAAALAAHADVGLYAARSAARAARPAASVDELA
jgi:hypothetical protein